MPVAGRPKGAQSPARGRAVLGRASAAGTRGLDPEQGSAPLESVGPLARELQVRSPSSAPLLGGLSPQEEQGWGGTSPRGGAFTPGPVVPRVEGASLPLGEYEDAHTRVSLACTPKCHRCVSMDLHQDPRHV